MEKKEAKGSDIAYCKNWTNEDSVELFECRFVGGSERDRELLRLVGLTVLQGLAGKRKAAKEPHQALSGRPFLLPLFVLNQLFESGRERGGSVISGADFLRSVRWEGYE